MRFFFSFFPPFIYFLFKFSQISTAKNWKIALWNFYSFVLFCFIRSTHTEQVTLLLNLFTFKIKKKKSIIKEKKSINFIKNNTKSVSLRIRKKKQNFDEERKRLRDYFSI